MSSILIDLTQNKSHPFSVPNLFFFFWKRFWRSKSPSCGCKNEMPEFNISVGFTAFHSRFIRVTVERWWLCYSFCKLSSLKSFFSFSFPRSFVSAPIDTPPHTYSHTLAHTLNYFRCFLYPYKYIFKLSYLTHANLRLVSPFFFVSFMVLAVRYTTNKMKTKCQFQVLISLTMDIVNY